MNLTPSQRGSFLAGIGLWILFWLSLFKADEIADVAHMRRVVNSAQCVRWINRHKSASLLGTELFNYSSHGISDPLGVTFALGGTLVNVVIIYLLLPLLERRISRSTSIPQ